MVYGDLGKALVGVGRPGKRIEPAVVRYLRRAKSEDDAENEAATDRPIATPEALIDAWLLEQFPGRFLEELDQIDVNRLLRARTARGLESVETKRRRFLAKKIAADAIDKAEWKIIEIMDAIDNGD